MKINIECIWLESQNVFANGSEMFEEVVMAGIAYTFGEDYQFRGEHKMGSYDT